MNAEPAWPGDSIEFRNHIGNDLLRDALQDQIADREVGVVIGNPGETGRVYRSLPRAAQRLHGLTKSRRVPCLLQPGSHHLLFDVGRIRELRQVAPRFIE